MYSMYVSMVTAALGYITVPIVSAEPEGVWAVVLFHTNPVVAMALLHYIISYSSLVTCLFCRNVGEALVMRQWV